MTPLTVWSHADLACLPAALPAAPPIGPADLRVLVAGQDLWDMWPLARADGGVAAVACGVLWFVLSAPARPDPVERHGRARIRLLWQVGGAWHDLGPALPEGFGPGSREWSGSAVLAPDGDRVTLYFTAAGRAGEPALSFEQRLFEITGSLALAGGRPALRWHARPRLVLAGDGVFYRRAAQPPGTAGVIEAFRDPAYFQDPADKRAYLLFAATLGAAPPGEAAGAVGLAVQEAGSWLLLPPLLHARGLNHELERPHLLFRDGRYYLFWCTQAAMFVPRGAAPTGLYGMVADRLSGPYRPLNGSGLVVANPPAQPEQAYGWWVTGDLAVSSFIDFWGVAGGAGPGAVRQRAQFGGMPAPFLQLALAGDRACMVPAR